MSHRAGVDVYRCFPAVQWMHTYGHGLVSTLLALLASNGNFQWDRSTMLPLGKWWLLVQLAIWI